MQDPALIAPKPRAGTREWVGLSVLALPAFVIALDFSVLNLAVPEISRQLMPSATELLWIVDIYGFMLAGLLVTMGTLGDRIGRRRLLMIGAAGFGLASVAAAYSVSAGPRLGAAATGRRGLGTVRDQHRVRRCTRPIRCVLRRRGHRPLVRDDPSSRLRLHGEQADQALKSSRSGEGADGLPRS